MIFQLFVTVFLIGFAILLAILGVMRGFYRASIFQPPDIPGDAFATVALDDCHKQSNRRHHEISELRRC
jgi:hypothetical protein